MDTTAICTGCQWPLPVKAPDRSCRKRLIKAGLARGWTSGRTAGPKAVKPANAHGKWNSS